MINKVILLLIRKPGNDPTLFLVPEVQAVSRATTISRNGYHMLLQYDANPCPGRQKMDVVGRWDGKEFV